MEDERDDFGEIPVSIAEQEETFNPFMTAMHFGPYNSIGRITQRYMQRNQDGDISMDVPARRLCLRLLDHILWEMGGRQAHMKWSDSMILLIKAKKCVITFWSTIVI